MLLTNLLVALLVVTVTSKPFAREFQSHGSAWQEFATIFQASMDLAAGGEVRVNGLPPVMLDAVADRISTHVPSTRIHRAGCVASADQLVGPSAKGSYDLLLPPNTNGKCKAPSLNKENEEFTMEMEWRGESVEQELRQSALPPVEKVFDLVFARTNGKARQARREDPKLNFWLVSFVNWFHDDNFRTIPNTDGGYTWSDRGSLHMAQLYGHTEYRQRALRTLAGDGKMKTSSRLGWD